MKVCSNPFLEFTDERFFAIFSTCLRTSGLSCCSYQVLYLKQKTGADFTSTPVTHRLVSCRFARLQTRGNKQLYLHLVILTLLVANGYPPNVIPQGMGRLKLRVGDNRQ